MSASRDNDNTLNCKYDLRVFSKSAGKTALKLGSIGVIGATSGVDPSLLMGGAVIGGLWAVVKGGHAMRKDFVQCTKLRKDFAEYQEKTRYRIK
jgi:hypothetical protein